MGPSGYCIMFPVELDSFWRVSGEHACMHTQIIVSHGPIYTHILRHRVFVSVVTWLLTEGVVKHSIYGFGPVTWLKCGDGEFSGAC